MASTINSEGTLIFDGRSENLGVLKKQIIFPRQFIFCISRNGAIGKRVLAFLDRKPRLIPDNPKFESYNLSRLFNLILGLRVLSVARKF